MNGWSVLLLLGIIVFGIFYYVRANTEYYFQAYVHESGGTHYMCADYKLENADIISVHPDFESCISACSSIDTVARCRELSDNSTHPFDPAPEINATTFLVEYQVICGSGLSCHEGSVLTDYNCVSSLSGSESVVFGEYIYRTDCIIACQKISGQRCMSRE